jgi:hypothetical protein
MQPLRQRFSGEQLHGEEDHLGRSLPGRGIAMRAEVVNPANIRMRHAFGELHFALKAGEGPRVAEHLRADGLQRQPLTQFQVVDFIDVTHAPGRDESHHAETAGQQIPLGKTRRHGSRSPEQETRRIRIGGD